MSRKFSLIAVKEWLTLADTAKHLSILFGEQVLESDVLQIALDRHLNLSVNFVNPVLAQVGRFVEIDGLVPEQAEDMGKTINHFPSHDFLADEEGRTIAFEQSKKIRRLVGVCDLLMIGRGAAEIQRAFHEAVTGAQVTLDETAGIYVRDRKSGEVLKLMRPNKGRFIAEISNLPNVHEQKEREHFDHTGADKDLQAQLVPLWARFSSLSQLPEGTLIVVRTEELTKFENGLADDATSADPSKQSAVLGNSLTRQQKAGASKVESTIRKIIYGLAVAGYGYDPTKQRSEAVNRMVEDMESAVGIKIDATTLRTYLRDAAKDCRGLL